VVAAVGLKRPGEEEVLATATKLVFNARPDPDKEVMVVEMRIEVVEGVREGVWGLRSGGCE
jgi:hypothetical protein